MRSFSPLNLATWEKENASCCCTSYYYYCLRSCLSENSPSLSVPEALKTLNKTPIPAEMAKASDKLAEIFQPQEFLYSDEEDDTTAKVASHEDEEQEDGPQLKRSSLRVRNVSMLDDVDERYSGTKISRRSLKDEKDDDVEEIEVDEDEAEEFDDDDNGGEDSELEDDNEISSDDSESEEDGGVGDENEMSEGDAESSDEETDVLANLSGRDTNEEIAKGRATQNQLKVFDALLETRIRLQKILIESNKLPQNETYASIVNNKLENGPTSNPAPCQSSLRLLLDNLIQFQDVMVKSNSETRKAMSRKRKQVTDVNDDLEEDDEVEEPEDAEEAAPKKRTRNEDYATEIGTRFNSFTKFRNDTIHKWNEKTQTLSKNFASFKTPILKQVEHILKDKERLVKRTQMKRSEYAIIGAAAVDDMTNCEEIYDDDDFYHQLLRELIERKTTDVSEPSQLSRHWLELQKMRSKMKRKIDTKASKGRRIRYEVHSKLVNFMAPYDACPMTDNAMNELYGSLFGGGKAFSSDA